MFSEHPFLGTPLDGCFVPPIISCQNRLKKKTDYKSSKITLNGNAIYVPISTKDLKLYSARPRIQKQFRNCFIFYVMLYFVNCKLLIFYPRINKDDYYITIN